LLQIQVHQVLLASQEAAHYTDTAPNNKPRRSGVCYF
jgi:hypothetical protein